jgi:hypothetical protein
MNYSSSANVNSDMHTSPRRRHVLSVCMLACSAVAAAHAQQSKPAIDQMLSRVEANTEQYKASVPSFVCDEHITSQEIHEGKTRHETTVDALFRVSRSASQGGALTESREIKTVNGKPSGDKKLNVPIAFSGGFSGALAKFLSADHHSCFDYQTDSSAPRQAGAEAYTFTAREAALKEPACSSIQPGTSGKFVIDSASMQVTHIERTVPNPVGKDRDILGTAAVDFAAVTLNGQSFWLPVTITAFTTETPKTDGFLFTAHYSNYHRFAASSVILPTTDSPTSPPSE